MGLEIERKFLYNGSIDSLNYYKKLIIVQTYLHKDDELELRVRETLDLEAKESTYALTIKHGHGLVRREYNIPLSNIIGRALLRLNSKRLVKVRHCIQLNDGLVAELDWFKILDLKFIEVEFPHRLAANDFVPPEWFGEEVTDDPRYSNYEIWKSQV